MPHSVFISYRRDGGEGFAHLIYKELSQRGYCVFYDIEKLGQGFFDEKILRKIDQSEAVLVILSKNALDRCVNEDDWVRREISYAIKQEKAIIPLFYRGFEFPAVLPEGMTALPRYNGVNLHDMEYYDAKIEHLMKMIDEAAARGGSPDAPPVSEKQLEGWNAMAERLYENDRYEEAFEYYHKAALGGHAGAQFNLGMCYLTGEGADRDTIEAAYWFEKAARAGRMDAQFNLGMCYEHGRGVERSIPKALYWYQLAAEQGDRFALDRYMALS